MQTFTLLSTLFFIFCWSVPICAGKLEQTKNEIRGEDTDQPDHDDDNDDNHHHRRKKRSHGTNQAQSDSTITDIGNEIIFDIFIHAIALPFWAPHTLLSDHFHCPFGYDDYPFARQQYGLIMKPADCPAYLSQSQIPDAQAHRKDQGIHNYSLHLELGYSYQIDEIHLGRATVRLDSISRFGLLHEWMGFIEQDGNNTDYLIFSKLDLTYQFANSRSAIFRTGFGVRSMVDSADPRFGVHFTYDADIYIVQPIGIAFALDIGNIGKTFMFDSKLNLVGYIHRMSIAAGISYTLIGTARFIGPQIVLGFFI